MKHSEKISEKVQSNAFFSKKKLFINLDWCIFFLAWLSVLPHSRPSTYLTLSRHLKTIYLAKWMAMTTVA